MKLGMLLNEDELINNFTFAEAVFASPLHLSPCNTKISVIPDN